MSKKKIRLDTPKEKYMKYVRVVITSASIKLTFWEGTDLYGMDLNC
jgi:hypothetical protein